MMPPRAEPSKTETLNQQSLHEVNQKCVPLVYFQGISQTLGPLPAHTHLSVYGNYIASRQDLNLV